MTNQPHPQPYVPGPWPVRPSHGGATAALVCGIIGLIMVPGVGIIAWIIGHVALKEIDSSAPDTWANRDHAVVGKVLGILSTVLYGVICGALVLLYAGMFAFFIGAVS